ncbi:peptide deformylase [Microbaculum marinum]|uniref:Peptide deformylase n=1 Tax=Microbaculum marinum TaxID=1764581 RepID=A0AAW9RNB1_9HYPH
MTIRDIVLLPDPVLRTQCEPVEAVDDAVRALMDDMLETMYDAPGIGLAAIQIGVPKRLVVIDVSRDEDAKKPLFLVNPEIVWQSPETSIYEEGCLSIPDYYEEVERPAACKVRFLDRDGKEQELACEGLLAVCVQHEIDHLNGVLFIDHISRLRRDRVVKKFAKAAKRGELPEFKRRRSEGAEEADAAE